MPGQDIANVRRELKRAIRDIRLQDSDTIYEIAKMRPQARVLSGGGITIITNSGLSLSEKQAFYYDPAGGNPFDGTPSAQKFAAVRGIVEPTPSTDGPVTKSADHETFTVTGGDGLYDITYDLTFGLQSGSTYEVKMHLEVNGTEVGGSKGYVGV